MITRGGIAQYIPRRTLRDACLHRCPSIPCRRDMSVQAISWVIDHSKHKGNTFVVLLMIANHAKSDGTGAWPSVQTICKESRLSRRTVQRCVNRLSRRWKYGDPELVVRIGKGPYGSNLYDIPSVRLTQGGRQVVTGGASDTDAGGASQVTPNPSLTVPKDKDAHINLILKARQESERTGESADTILKRLRAMQ